MNQAQVKTRQAAQQRGSLRNTISPLSGWRSVVDKIARESFIAAMRNAATGVNVVTTDGAAGRFGITVSAFASVSAEPLTVLVCINRDSPARDAILANGRFCVNVLSAGQTDVANKTTPNTVIAVYFFIFDSSKEGEQPKSERGRPSSGP